LSEAAPQAEYLQFDTEADFQQALDRLLAALDRSRLKHVVAAHLSQQNNRADLARAALARALDCAEDWVGVATQEAGFAWRDLA